MASWPSISAVPRRSGWVFTQVYNVIENDNIVSNLHVTWNINFIVVVMVKGIMSYNKDTLTAASSLACLEIRSRNEEVINSTRNRIYSLKVFNL